MASLIVVVDTLLTGATGLSYLQHNDDDDDDVATGDVESATVLSTVESI